VGSMNSIGGGVLALSQVTKRFGTTLALEDVSLVAHHGLTSILGPNGAGKTTLLALVLGQLRPDSGTVRALGGEPGEMAVRLRMGAMLQAAALAPRLTVRETIEQFSSYYHHPYSLADALAYSGLEDLADRRYGALSGGQQRRVQFAVAICGRPELLLLDEPTVALDAQARRTVWAVVRDLVARGSSVILTTHQLEEAEALSDRVIVLAAGRIVADGAPAAVKARVASRRIRCITQLVAEEVARWPLVHNARRAGQHLEIVCEAAESVLRALLERDAQLSDLSVVGSTLEDAVLELTRRSTH
jgi:ABC-2 type transport system ATP-binding protein